MTCGVRRPGHDFPDGQDAVPFGRIIGVVGDRLTALNDIVYAVGHDSDEGAQTAIKRQGETRPEFSTPRPCFCRSIAEMR